MLPTLDARLTAAAELVLPGKPVADIGCDHGKLTAVLAASGKYPRVIGADLRPGPLAKAEQTLEHAGCKDRVELRLGDGLSVLSAGEVGTIVLAGVSAQTTWEIIEQAPWVSQVGGPRLVMVPATRHSELRRWLWEHGFALTADRPVHGGPLVRRDGCRVHRRGAHPHLYRVPVRQNGRMARGCRICRLAEGQAPPFPAGRAGWDGAGGRDR